MKRLFERVFDAIAFPIRKHADWDGGATEDTVMESVYGRIEGMSRADFLEYVGAAVDDMFQELQSRLSVQEEIPRKEMTQDAAHGGRG